MIAGEVRHASGKARGSIGRQTRRPFLCPQQQQQDSRGGHEFLPWGSGSCHVHVLVGHLSVCPKASMRLWPGPWSTQKYRYQHVCVAQSRGEKNYFTALVRVLDTLMPPRRCCPAKHGPDVADGLMTKDRYREGQGAGRDTNLECRHDTSHFPIHAAMRESMHAILLECVLLRRKTRKKEAKGLSEPYLYVVSDYRNKVTPPFDKIPPRSSNL